jgi:hypothetical protein
MPEEEGVTPQREVVESVDAETLAGKGGASKASCSGDKRAPAGNHSPTGHATEMHAPTGYATEMHAAATETAAAEMHSTTPQSRRRRGMPSRALQW